MTVFIALGGNLAWEGRTPPQTFASALAAMAKQGVALIQASPIYTSPPWPHGDGPQFYNQVAQVETRLAPGALMKLLLKVEQAHGRIRREVGGPRSLDLDLLDYRQWVVDTEAVTLPHPRLDARAFVLLPLQDIAPEWRDPVTGEGLAQVIAQLHPQDLLNCRRFS